MAQNSFNLIETHYVGTETREWIVSPHQAASLSECRILLTGWSEAREGFLFIRLKPQISQVLVCAGGQGEVWIKDQWAPCKAGMAYITPPGCLHAYRAVPNALWTVYWVIHHDPIVGVKEPTLLTTDPQPLVSAIRHLYEEATGVADPRIVSHWAHLVHTGAQRLVRPVTYDPRLRRLWRLVQEKLAFSWDIPRLAAEAGISDEHLRRLCHREVGCSPMDYVTQLRMQHAIALLSTGGYTVGMIAQRVGYSSPFAFSAAFKRVMGVPPSQYLAARLSAAPTITPLSE